MNAEVIPLVRDVPLDVHVDQLALGGWDHEEARQIFAEFELRTVWPRFTALMDEGAFGEPAPGCLRSASGTGVRRRRRRRPRRRRCRRRPDGSTRVAGPPEVVVPRTPTPAVAGSPALFAAARQATGDVAAPRPVVGRRRAGRPWPA